VGNNDYFSIHPDVPAVAPQVHQTRRVHLSRNHSIWEREWQIKRFSAVHVNGVKNRARCGLPSDPHLAERNLAP
jgi:hypothetical protein